MEAAVKLGGIEEESQAGKHLWKFIVLPKIPVKILHYDADDEFPVSIKIMVDEISMRRPAPRKRVPSHVR